MKLYILILVFLANANNMFAQTKLNPLEEGSKIHFVIKNFGLKTNGSFKGLKGNIRFDAANIATAVFDVTVAANTVDTDNGSRDEHLKKESYFNVDKYPIIHLISTAIVATSKNEEYVFTGNLTIKGISKPVKFNFIAQKQKDKYLFTGSFTINRRDFNVGGSSFPLSENVLVSLDVLAK